MEKDTVIFFVPGWTHSGREVVLKVFTHKYLTNITLSADILKKICQTIHKVHLDFFRHFVSFIVEIIYLFETKQRLESQRQTRGCVLYRDGSKDNSV
jgi:hypothetical protein